MTENLHFGVALIGHISQISIQRSQEAERKERSRYRERSRDEEGKKEERERRDSKELMNVFQFQESAVHSYHWVPEEPATCL